MKTSSFVRKDGKTAGLLLVHYEPKENRIYAELLYPAFDIQETQNAVMYNR